MTGRPKAPPEPSEAALLAAALAGALPPHLPKHRPRMLDYLREAEGRAVEFDHEDRAALFAAAARVLAGLELLRSG